MIRAIRPNAMAQDDASLVSGWNVAPNVAYTLLLLPGASSCGVYLYGEDGTTMVASGAALAGTDQPCVLIPQTGQTVGMVDAELGWHLLLTTTGTESQRTIRLGPAVDLPDEIHPVYADDDMALARATAAIDEAAHYIDDITVTCPLGLGASLGDVVSVPVDGAAVVGQVESVTWTATPDGTTEQAVIRRHVAIAPEAFVEPTPPTPPTLAADTASTDADTEASGNVLDNDDAGLTVVAVDGLSGNVGSAVAGSAGGLFTINSDGSWSFDPNGDFDGIEEDTETAVTYYASNGEAEASTTLTVTVSPAASVDLWTPAEIEGAVVFDALASETITEDTGCSAWADMLGRGITATQATAGAQPAVGDGVLTFDGGDYLTISGSKSEAWVKAMHSTGGTVLAVLKVGTSADPNVTHAIAGTSLWASTSIGFTVAYDDRASIPRNNAAVTHCSAGGGTKVVDHAVSNVITPNTIGLHTWRIDPDNATAANRTKFSANGAAEVGANTETGTRSTSNATADLMIGGCGTTAYGLLVGDIACMMFVPDVVSAEDLARLQGWAAHRHGTADLLPSDHPYKSAAPTI